MANRIFIDGESGTTGLQIADRLSGRSDLNFIRLSETERKDPAARAKALNDADIVILCLPDDAAREAVTLIENDAVRVIDASSAHRTADGWTYGFPEYAADQRAEITVSKRVTNPGCYAISAVGLLAPLVQGGLLTSDAPITLNAISGYSGGGKALIGEFEDTSREDYSEAPFWVYGLSLSHKHVPEIQQWSGLAHRPLMVPSVGRFKQGMIVQVPLQLWSLPGSPSPDDLVEAYKARYRGEEFVEVADLADTAAMTRLHPETLNGTNKMRIHVFASPDREQAVVMTLIDNLGKGASGQAVQNLNIMLGVDEATGL